MSIAGLALQQDHLRNQSKEDRFLISGLKQTGRPAVGLAAQKSAGLLIMSSLLGIIYQGSSHPIVREVIVVKAPSAKVRAYLPSFLSLTLPQLLRKFDLSS